MTARPAVLVLDSDSEHLAWTSGIVRIVDPSARSATRLDNAQSIADYDLIVVNYDGLQERDRRRLFEAIDQYGADGPRLLLVSSAVAEAESLFHELEQHQLTNLLTLDGEVSETDLLVTTRKLLRRDIFGVDKYFGDDVEQATAMLQRSGDISTAVDAATKFASDLGVHPRLIENTATVVDELVTNALYNAPIDAAGAHRFAHLPRTTAVELDPGEQVALTLCSDGERLGISVVDPFGALTKEQSLEYLVSCIRGQDEKPSREKGGAGLGLYMTFDALNHLILNICRGEQTEVIGLIDIRGSYRDFVARGKSFNIFRCAHDGH